ncbi:Reticulon-domain-containing protein [Halteromyces radiatus]|uniref:Reticulon-domain-containing protein n=1 Tax=Halteromyces radiatus TaxID=101107 RepID=UPI0022201CF5|nr:Reticulon-domain-containing protein [Halteromyces radiatus]KAI8092717.1 Reticulon-domain-containing protein [Halteromyces radiatus]
MDTITTEFEHKVETTQTTEVQSPSEPIPTPRKTEEVPKVTNPVPTQTNGLAKNTLYQSPNIKFEDDPAAYIKARISSLIYWEHPRRSATYLGVSLSVLILTQYYSLLQILACFFTLATGANWIYVNTHKQTQRIIAGKSGEDIKNPHSERLRTKGAMISRDRVTYAAQLSVDVFEVIAQQVTRLILIEDNTQSAVAIAASFSIWTLAKHISTKYLVGFFLVSAFTFPRLYLQHQEVIDAHVAQHSEKARILARQYGGVASTKAQELYDQAWAAIKKQPKSQKAE